jgi:hypothetical protein
MLRNESGTKDRNYAYEEPRPPRLTMQARLAPWAVTSASVAYGMQSNEFAGRAGLTVSW